MLTHQPAPTTAAARDPEDERISGLMATSPVVNAAAAMEPFQAPLIGPGLSGGGIMDALDAELLKLQSGDMAAVEGMLFAQAASLQAIYASLARRAGRQEQTKHSQAMLMLALKAQAQSRATLEALVELKNPRHPATFVKQANIAQGPQQVNNGVASSAHAGPLGNEQSRVLEAQQYEQRLDTGAQGAAGAGNPQLEAVGAVHRADHA